MLAPIDSAAVPGESYLISLMNYKRAPSCSPDPVVLINLYWIEQKLVTCMVVVFLLELGGPWE